MPYVLADRRDLDLFVVDAENGIRTHTRDPRRARLFENGDKARAWASTHLLTCEFEAVVMLNARPILKKNAARLAGQSGVNSSASKEPSDDHSTFPEATCN